MKKYSMKDDEGQEFAGAISCILVDLSQLSAIAEKPVGEMAPMEMWGVFLAGADNPRYRGKVDEIAAARKEIGMADNLLKNLSMDESEQHHFRMRRKWKADRDHDLIVAKREGEERGIAIGEERGIAIGEERGIAIGEERGIAIGEERGIAIGEEHERKKAEEDRKNTIISLRRFNVPTEAIAQSVRLTVDEVMRVIDGMPNGQA